MAPPDGAPPRGQVVNLRLARKRARRAEATEIAAEQRAKFGRTKAEKVAERRRTEEATRQQDGKRLD